MKAQENAAFVAINAVEVPAERAEAFAERFANRAGAVSSSPGFVRFELFRPADGNTRWLVVTHWRSREDFNACLERQSFGRARGHRFRAVAVPGRAGGVRPADFRGLAALPAESAGRRPCLRPRRSRVKIAAG